MYKSVKGIVLKEVRYKENDKLLTIYTDTEGKITVTAHGAFSKKSSVSSAAQLLTFSDMELDLRNGRYSVKEAQIIENFANLKKDIVDFSLGCYFAECVDSFCLEDVSDSRFLRVLLNALYAVDNLMYPQKQIKAAFELKISSLIGYEPLVEACAKCGNSNPKVVLFGTADGQIYCGDCYSPDSGDCVYLQTDTLKAIRYILQSDIKRFISFKLPSESLEELYRVSESYLRYHSDRKISTLDYWKSLL